MSSFEMTVYIRYFNYKTYYIR